MTVTAVVQGNIDPACFKLHTTAPFDITGENVIVISGECDYFACGSYSDSGDNLTRTGSPNDDHMSLHAEGHESTYSTEAWLRFLGKLTAGLLLSSWPVAEAENLANAHWLHRARD